MQVLIKTLQQKQVPLTVEPSDSVLSLKEKIASHPDLSVEVGKQKLIHAGRILDNEQTVEAVGIKPDGFIVLMILNKPATAPATAKPSAAAKPTVASAEAVLVTGPEYEEAVSRLMEMGFDREAVTKAMKASFNNPDRAFEYLSQHEDGDDDGDGEDDEENDENDSNPLGFLRNDPQFQELRAMVMQNPALIGPILEQLGQTSPELFALIDQHREEFIHLMNEGNYTALDDEGDQEEIIKIEISPEDEAAIERLVQLGFDRAMALEAYLACDRDEQMAANFLFESME